jgi:hypothetical protein
METIKIPRRFQEGLRKKFDVNNFSEDLNKSFFNVCSCPLCVEHKKGFNCTGCPFLKFKGGLYAGCSNFLQAIKGMLGIECLIMLTEGAVFTDNLQNLEKIINKAKEYIEFVENTNGDN